MYSQKKGIFGKFRYDPKEEYGNYHLYVQEQEDVCLIHFKSMITPTD